MIEAHFGESAAFSLGVEEEVMILDGETLAQVPRVDAVAGERAAGRLKTELFASVVELNTPICATAADALETLRALRAEAGRSAREHGLAVAAAGTHPFSVPEEQEIADDERYRRFVEYAGATARRQGVNGLHVHVGMPTADTCFSVMEQILPWLPVVLALSANSPYLAGNDTGLLSARAEILGTLPRSGAPPQFGSYAGWERFVERMQRTGIPLASDYTSFWWDVRPHPKFGTLEIRMPDQPTSLALTGALVALLQALCKTVAERGDNTTGERGDYQQNRWAASRFGPRAELIHPDGDRAVVATDLAVELLELVSDAAAELGSSELLSALNPSRCEAERQLWLGSREGLRAVCADLVERFLESG